MKHINKEHITRNTKYVNCLKLIFRIGDQKTCAEKIDFSRYFRYFCTTYGEQMNEDFFKRVVSNERERTVNVVQRSINLSKENKSAGALFGCLEGVGQSLERHAASWKRQKT